MRKKQRAAYGYASASSEMTWEYASAGTAAVPVAANSAAGLPTIVRARKYVGKTTAVIVKTPM